MSTLPRTTPSTRTARDTSTFFKAPRLRSASIQRPVTPGALMTESLPRAGLRHRRRKFKSAVRHERLPRQEGQPSHRVRLRVVEPWGSASCAGQGPADHQREVLKPELPEVPGPDAALWQPLSLDIKFLKARNISPDAFHRRPPYCSKLRERARQSPRCSIAIASSALASFEATDGRRRNGVREGQRRRDATRPSSSGAPEVVSRPSAHPSRHQGSLDHWSRTLR